MTAPLLFGVLAGSGLAWGATTALSKVAVSTGHGPFGLILWQMVLGALLMGAICLILRRPLPLTRATLTFALVVALLGTLLPNTTSYLAYAHLPAGIMAIVIATVPMLAFLVALALGQDRFTPARLTGLALGLGGVALIAAPGLPGGIALGWLLLAMLGPLFYAFESNFVARFGMAGLDAFQAMFLASATGALICLPVALVSGQVINPLLPWGDAEWAITWSSVLHSFAYAAYVWLAARAGAVFAAQTSYIVTGSGVLWAMALLGERFSPWVWAALALMLAGVALVQPREGQTMTEAH